jgi:hypothetical protein
MGALAPVDICPSFLLHASACVISLPHRQQGKACSDDIKVFSRALPWEHVGEERGVRLLIARTLAPGEVPPPTPAAVAAAAAAAAKGQAGKRAAKQQQSDASADAAQQQGSGQLSRKQRKLRERAARIRAMQEAAAGAAPAGEAPDSPQQDDASRDAVVIIADQEPSTKQNSAGFAAGKLSAAAGDAGVLELPSLTVRSKGPSSTAESSSSNGTGVTSSSTSTLSAANPEIVSASSPRIHACIVLDPIYSGGRVIGYTAERSFLHPAGVKGAVKLLQRHAVELLQAEGLARLNLGLAVGYEVKPGVQDGLFALN